MDTGSVTWQVRSKGRDVEIEWSEYTENNLFNPIILLGEPRLVQ